MPAKQKYNFIRSITVSKLVYPLYDHLVNPTQLFYDIGEKTVYGLHQEEAYPVASASSVLQYSYVGALSFCLKFDHSCRRVVLVQKDGQLNNFPTTS